MLKQFYGRCRFTLRLTAKSDLLVQGEQREATGSATFLRARDPTTGRESYCIPASSFKGVLRSSAEQILRSFAPWLACDPFDDEKSSLGVACSHRWTNEDLPPDQVYGCLCPACRLFGCTLHAGLLTPEDAWLDGKQQPGSKTGIAIDRFTGGVKHGALYSFDPLPAGTAFGPLFLAVDNFALWQLGLLALVLRDLDAGRVRLGWGSRKGLGRVAVAIEEVAVRYPCRLYGEAAGGLPDAQGLAGFRDGPGDGLRLLPELQPEAGTSWRDAAWVDLRLRDEVQIKQFLGGCVEEALAPRLQAGYQGFAYDPPHKEDSNA